MTELNIEAELQDIERRFSLLEGGKKTTLDTKNLEIKQNTETLESVKSENKMLKKTLRDLHREHGNRGKDAQERELAKLETEVHQLRKQYDELKYKTKYLMKQLRIKLDMQKDIEKESSPILTDESALTRKIRILENRLDKAMIKYNEAQSIRKTYEQIVKRLKEERIGFDNQLQAIERTLKTKQHDYQELLSMSHDAIFLKEQAKAELEAAKQEFKEKRRNKEKELKEKKQYVQARIEMTAKLTKKDARAKKDDSRLDKHDESTSPEGKSFDAKMEEDMEHLEKLEEIWRRIKEVTGVNDANEVIQKYLSSNDTNKNLVQMTKDAAKKIEQLQLKKQEIKAQLEEIKYTQSSGLGSRRIVDEFVQQVAEAKSKLERNKQKYERISKILINVKAGIEHLSDKLRAVDGEKPMTPAKDLSDESIVDLLKECEERLTKLMEEVQKEATLHPPVTTDIEIPPVVLGANNVRIKLDEEEDVEAETESETEEEGDVLDRAQVKKLATLAMEKNKKKKSKKER